MLAYSAGALANPTPDILHEFNLKDGAVPLAGLVWDKGELYGTTSRGGNTACQGGYGGGCGVVFKLTPPASGEAVWTETVLYKFAGANDGHFPNSALIVGKSGVLYGTTANGGDNTACPTYTYDIDIYDYPGCGVVFSLAPPAAGKTAWTYTTIYKFTGRSDGAFPSGGLVMDKSGALYGMTSAGGDSAACPNDPYLGAPRGCGVAFKLVPPAAGKTAWTETVLHDFASAKERFRPSGIVMDDTGALYGTATTGSNESLGIVFELTPPAAGQASWTSTVLYKFARSSGGIGLVDGLIMDKAGALYGTTYEDKTATTSQPVTSTVFRLQPPAAGKTAWTGTVLHTFAGHGAPSYLGGLVFDKNGVLYGTAAEGGGSRGGFGVVFKLTPASGNSPWPQTEVYRGGSPVSVVLGSSGAVFGVASEGGSPNCEWDGLAYDSGSCGYIFKVVP